jgi:hypothetical protein
MDATEDKRKEERIACESTAKIAFYVPVEYEAFYEPNSFTSTIVDFSDNGLGIELENKVKENTVVNILFNDEFVSEKNSPFNKVYQSKILWTKKIDPQTSRIGVRHIR